MKIIKHIAIYFLIFILAVSFTPISVKAAVNPNYDEPNLYWAEFFYEAITESNNGEEFERRIYDRFKRDIEIYSSAIILEALKNNISEGEVQSIFTLLGDFTTNEASSIIDIIEKIKLFKTVYDCVNGIVENFNSFEENVTRYRKADIMLEAMNNTFTLLSEFITTISPGLGHIVSLPIKTAQMMLPPVQNLVYRIKEYNDNILIIDLRASGDNSSLTIREALDLHNKYTALMNEKLELEKYKEELAKIALLFLPYYRLHDSINKSNVLNDLLNVINDINRELRLPLFSLPSTTPPGGDNNGGDNNGGDESPDDQEPDDEIPGGGKPGGGTLPGTPGGGTPSVKSIFQEIEEILNALVSKIDVLIGGQLSAEEFRKQMGQLSAGELEILFGLLSDEQLKKLLSRLDEEELEKILNKLRLHGFALLADAIEEMLEAREDARKQASPLTINIDGTGIETLSVKDGVYFDHLGNGFRIKTGWVAPNSGLLVRGVNENSRIISGRNLFGDNTLLKNGRLAANGFEALKDLDDNRDRTFDAKDAAWHELHLWFDLNSNGKIEPGELVPLSETGIVSIDLNYYNSNYVDANGNSFKQISTATMQDGTVVDVVDIWFSRNLHDSIAVDRVKVSDDIKNLPQIRGFGTAHSLHQAMMQDSSGQLKALVEQFGSEENEAVRRGLVPQIIYRWTGANNNIAAMDALTGTRYTGGTGPDAMAILNAAFDKLAVYIYEILMSQSHYLHLYNRMLWNNDSELYDLSRLSREIVQTINTDQEKGEKLFIGFIMNIQALRMFNSVDHASFKKSFADENHRTVLIADILSKNIICGTTGNDILIGTNTDSAFIAGNGNNIIRSGYGDDTFFFDENSGVNTIRNSGGNNIIILSGINQADISAQINMNNIEIIINRSGGKLIFQGYCDSVGYTFVFPDGIMVDFIDLVRVDIATAEELAAMRNNLNGIYRLVSDIDLGGVDWAPVGSASSPFNGIFDGNGFTISNLAVARAGHDNVGLFGFSTGLIKGLTIDGAAVSGRNNVGGLAGSSSGRIEGCSVLGGGISGATNTGGLAGISTGTVSGSGSSGGTVTGGTGGGTGGLLGTSTGTVSGSYSHNDVRGFSSVGGFIGSASGTVRLSYATGSVTATGFSMGGFIGAAGSVAITDSFATGNVTPGSSSGGFHGSGTSGTRAENCYSVSNNPNGLTASLGTFVNCYFNVDLISGTSTRPQARTTEQMNDMATYTGWDFETVWVMDANGYPLLRVFGHTDIETQDEVDEDDENHVEELDDTNDIDEIDEEDEDQHEEYHEEDEEDEEDEDDELFEDETEEEIKTIVVHAMIPTKWSFQRKNYC